MSPSIQRTREIEQLPAGLATGLPTVDQGQRADSDAQERKRERNRIAQRMFRERRKKHVQDLERKAALAMSASEPTPKTSAHQHQLLQDQPASSGNGNASNSYNGVASPDSPCEASTHTQGMPDDSSLGLDPPTLIEEEEFFQWPLEHPAEPIQADLAPRLAEGGPSSRPEDDLSTMLNSPELYTYTGVEQGSISRDSGMHDSSTVAPTKQPFHQETRMFKHQNRFPDQHMAPLHGRPPGPSIANSSSSSNYGLSERSQLTAQLEALLQYLRTNRVRNLDAIVRHYYTADMTNPGQASAQRMGRNRHLPALLADLRDSAGKWSDWEAQPYKNEIVKSTERLLTDEYSACKKDIKVKSLLLQLQADDGDDDIVPKKQQIIADAQALFQEVLPNFSALATTLITSSDADFQEDPSHKVLATTLIMLFSSELPAHRLKLWIESCLGM